MAWLYRFSIRHPKVAMAIAALVTLAAAPGILRLELRTDGHALVPHDAPEIAIDRAIRAEFGTYDPIVVLIKSKHAKGIFNVETMTLVRDLTNSLMKISGLRPADVFSLATEHGHRVRPGTLYFRTFLEPLPRTREQLNTLREDLRTIRLYTGTLVSYDGSATSILVGVPPGMNRIGLCERIQGIIDERGDIAEETHIIGAPVAEALLGSHLLEDLGVPSALLGFRPWEYQEDDLSAWHIPTSLSEFRRLIGRRIGLVPIAIGVMAVVFMLFFRSITATMLPLAEVGACLVFVFGLMGWVGVPVYLTIAVLPVILTAIGVADEIHIFTRYRELVREQPEPDATEIVHMTMAEMCAPVVKTSVTTAVGFLSFALSPIGPVRAFGIFTAAGVIFCMLWSLTVVPAMLAVLGPDRLLRRGGPAGGNRVSLGTKLFSRIGSLVIGHRRAAVGAGLLIVLAAPWGVRRIVIQDSWIDGFAPDSEFRQATELFNEQFLGTHMLLVRVDGPGEVVTGTLTPRELNRNEIRIRTADVADFRMLRRQKLFLEVVDRPKIPGPPRINMPERNKWIARIEATRREGDDIVLTTERNRGWAKPLLRLNGPETLRYRIAPEPLTQPAIVRRIADLEDFIKEHREQAVGGVIGTADYLATTNFIARGRKEEARAIPDRPARISWLWSQFERIRGRDRRRQIIDADYDRSLISVFLKDANFVDTQKLMDDIRDYERANLNPVGITLEFGGDVAVSQSLIGAIVSTQVRSLAVSLVGIMLITSFFGRSLIWGALCVLPCGVAVLVNFAIMGVVGMPLGVATSMFSGMTLGIGVDYAIHLLERYRLSCARGMAHDAAVADAVTVSGPAILIDALAVSLGFGILTMSQVPANSRLGALVVLSIAGCFAASIVLLPALLRLRRRPV